MINGFNQQQSEASELLHKQCNTTQHNTTQHAASRIPVDAAHEHRDLLGEPNDIALHRGALQHDVPFPRAVRSLVAEVAQAVVRAQHEPALLESLIVAASLEQIA